MADAVYELEDGVLKCLSVINKRMRKSGKIYKTKDLEVLAPNLNS